MICSSVMALSAFLLVQVPPDGETVAETSAAEAGSSETPETAVSPKEVPTSTANDDHGDVVDVAAHLQVRPRGEKSAAGNFLGRALPSDRNQQISQRTRMVVDVAGPGVAGYGASARMSLQDVRVWGSEESVAGDFSADNVDFHEAWGQLGDVTRYVRVGRQEVALDEERLIGVLDYAQQGRAFDGLRLGYQIEDVDLTVFATRLQDGGNHDMFIAHGSKQLPGGISLAVPLIIETDAFVAEGEKGGFDGYRWTGGVYAKNDEHPLNWRAEAYLQQGYKSEANLGILAYMVGLRVGYKVDEKLAPALWFDYLSGDGDRDDDTLGAFSTLYPTNHKFYGLADHFLDIPTHTNGGGLVDVALKNTGKVGPGVLAVAVHEFMLAQQDVLGRSGAIGAEIDVLYTVALTETSYVRGGVTGFFDQGDFHIAGARTFHDWSYLELNLQF